MAYLLDTPVVLWWLAESKRLSKKAFNLIQRNEDDLFVSSVSLWEIRTKETLGRIEVTKNFEKTLEQCGFLPLDLTWEHTTHLPHLENIHRDPFDRMLICQAKSEKLTLLTSDKSISMYRVKTSW